MYLDTAERITDRRLELNKSNAATSLLIMAGIGAISSWSFGKPDVQAYAVFVVGSISVLAAIFCRWWWQQIVSYKDLNGAKFEVLNEMAPLIVFPDETSCRSFEPFSKEWRAMENKMALQKYKSRLALGASLSELTVPITFMTAFCAIFLITVVVSMVSRYDLVLVRVLGF
uniref:RipA family octameric membrane protein n=1 Tax=Primorskyibacter flagellatus TaxID=1387277 RepID=UPI001666E780|nr:hypothetical protein [Primorskyibacter flagellatus]